MNPPEPPPDLTGRTLGDYELLRKLGQGAMGQVYLARQRSLKREVALKILRSDYAQNPTALQRFQAEAEAVARLTHPNIVQVYAVGEQDGLRFMALEYVQGRNLREYLSRKGCLDAAVAIVILKQIAAALLKASEVGLIHRDIKPDNILLTRKIEVKVADFGLSRYDASEGKPLNLTQSGMTLGTPLYMAPEQVQGQTVDHRSDLYSLGVTAYHMLAGQTPFRGATAFDVAVQHVQVEPPALAEYRPDLPLDLCQLVHKLLAKQPQDRYASARDVIRDLTRIQKGIPLEDAQTPGLSPAVSNAGPVRLMPPSPLPGAGSLSGHTSVASPSGTASWEFSGTPGTNQKPRSWSVYGWRGLGCLSAAAVGYLALAWWPETSTPPTAPGLPRIQLPTPLTSLREQELKTILRDRTAQPAQILAANLELGLLYLRERRLADAEAIFKALDSERVQSVNKPLVGQLTKLGEALVRAHQNRPQEAVERFLAVFDQKLRPGMVRQVEAYLIDHPELGEAVASALQILAESLPPERFPAALEYLRSPGGLMRGPKP